LDNLTDPLDIAAARTQQEIEAALAAHRDTERQYLQPNGHCHNCYTQTDGLYCDEECQAEHVEFLRKVEHQAMVNGGAHSVRYGQ
jgi:hypothetical protein